MAPLPPRVHVGSGKVTDSQVAFMVECYLRDSHFSRSLQEFRLEAARLLHPLRSVPKGARSLSAVLNDYVALKEEQISDAAEKVRVEELFHGLQEILSVYLSGVAKNAGPVGETRNEAISPPPFASPVGIQQPQVQVPYESEAAALPVKVPVCNMDQYAKENVDQYAKEKVSSHKRKTQSKSSSEPLQHGDSCVDLVKKPRRGSYVKQLSSDSSSVGNVSMVDSNVYATGTDCLVTSKTVQPATPPMTTASCKPQQQQAFHCGPILESPQPSPSPTEAAQSLVSPKHSSYTSTPLPSAQSDTADQLHQDPQTPSPSSTKSSLGNNSTFALVQVEETLDATTAPSGKPGNVQRRKGPVPHVSSATSHYALRAHRKPSEAPSIPLSTTQSNCAVKPTRKRAINSKCRLLDFSAAAAANADSHVDTMLKESIKASRTSGSSIQSLPDSDYQKITESSPTSNCEQVMDVASPSENLPTHETDATEFLLPSDAFSFDELFSLDLDTSLISELEDLAAITGCDTDPSSCLQSSDIASLPFQSQSSSGGVLSEIDNIIHSDEAAALTPRTGCLGASSFKHRKPATITAGNENLMDDKENIHALVASH